MAFIPKVTRHISTRHTTQSNFYNTLAWSLLFLDGREGLIPLSVEAEGDVSQEVRTDYDDALVPDGLPYLEEKGNSHSRAASFTNVFNQEFATKGKSEWIRKEKGWSKAPNTEALNCLERLTTQANRTEKYLEFLPSRTGKCALPACYTTGCKSLLSRRVLAMIGNSPTLSTGNTTWVWPCRASGSKSLPHEAANQTHARKEEQTSSRPHASYLLFSEPLTGPPPPYGKCPQPNCRGWTAIILTVAAEVA